MSGGSKLLLERERELEGAARGLADARSGRGRLIVIEGPAGIGKTSLLDEVSARAADQGFTTLGARSSELERDLALGVIAQLIGALGGVPATRRRRLFGGPARPALSLVDGSPAGLAAGPGAFHALFWLTAHLADECPVLLAVDDLQWADDPSRGFLDHLARRLDGLAVGLAVTARTPEAGARAVQVVARPEAVRLRPAPLSSAAVSVLVRRRFRSADDAFCAAFGEAAGGNPLLVEQLISEVDAAGIAPDGAGAVQMRAVVPAGLGQLVRSRLGRLPPEAVRLAEAVAVLGPDTPLGVAAGVAGLGADAASQAADALAAADLIAPRRPLAYTHPVVGAAVAGAMAPGARGAVHARAAWALHLGGGGAERVATHLLSADPVGEEWAVEALAEAGSLSRDRGAPGAAVRYLRRALDEPAGPEERARILLALGAAEARGRAPEAADHLRAALGQSPAGAARTAAAGELAQELVLGGRAAEGVEILDGAIADIPDRTSDLALQLEARRASLALMSLETAASVGPRLRAFRDLDGGRPAARGMLALLAMLAALEGESAARTAALAERALAGGALLADLTADSPLYYYPVNALTIAGRPRTARAALDAAIEDARGRGSPLGFAIAACWRAKAHLELGVVPSAAGDATSAITAAGEEGWPLSVVAHSLLAEAHLERGDLAAAEAALVAADRQRVPGDLVVASFPLAARARLGMARGEARDAVASWRACGEHLAMWESQGHRASLLPWRVGSGEALAAAGDLDGAHRIAAVELADARAFGAAGRLAAALRLVAHLSAPRDAVPLLEAAAAAVADGCALLEEARALLGLGEALRGLGRDREARDPLRRAVDVAHRSGATALQERARAALVAAGGRPRRLALSGSDALTPSERQVAAMASEGMSNREIAQALFLTQKTVERHLSGCFRKLEVSSRDGLPGAFVPGTVRTADLSLKRPAPVGDRGAAGSP